MELDTLKQIDIYYSKAWDSLKEGDLKAANKVLLKEMPEDLYELSLNILYNRNKKSITKEFKKTKLLIEKVDKKLTELLTKKDEEPDTKDRFINNIF